MRAMIPSPFHVRSHDGTGSSEPRSSRNSDQGPCPAGCTSFGGAVAGAAESDVPQTSAAGAVAAGGGGGGPPPGGGGAAPPPPPPPGGAAPAAAAVAAHDVLAEYGWDAVHARALSLAATLAERLHERGRTVAPRGETTLVSWEDDDPEATRDRVGGEGILIRNLPSTPYLRASVGAWNDEDDLERLLDAVAPVSGRARARR